MELITNRILQHLDHMKIPYERINHRRDYTARQTASDCSMKPACFAKVVVVEADGRKLLSVLPADHALDLGRFERLLGCDRISLLPESSLMTYFPDCELGALPALGNLYGLPVYVSPELTRQEKIAFNAGTHEQAIRMNYKDFDRMVRPTVIDFSYPTDRRAVGA